MPSRVSKVATKFKTVTYRVYAAVVFYDKTGERVTTKSPYEAIRNALNNQKALLRSIQKLVNEGIETWGNMGIGTWGGAKGPHPYLVSHIKDNMFGITWDPLDPDLTWPPFYFDEDQHNQATHNIKIDGKKAIIEIASTRSGLIDTLDQVYFADFRNNPKPPPSKSGLKPAQKQSNACCNPRVRCIPRDPSDCLNTIFAQYYQTKSSFNPKPSKPKPKRAVVPKAPRRPSAIVSMGPYIKKTMTKAHGVADRLSAADYYRRYGTRAIGTACDIRRTGELKCLVIKNNGVAQWQPACGDKAPPRPCLDYQYL